MTYLHTDQLNTPRIGTDSNQTIVWRWDSDAFGVGTPNEDPDGDSNTVTVDLRFPGQIASDGGVYYNYFRDYDPSTGRYIESDPIGLEGGLNTYGYVGGSPLSNMDIFGLTSISRYGNEYTQFRPPNRTGCQKPVWVGGSVIRWVPCDQPVEPPSYRDNECRADDYYRDYNDVIDDANQRHNDIDDKVGSDSWEQRRRIEEHLATQRNFQNWKKDMAADKIKCIDEAIFGRDGWFEKIHPELAHDGFLYGEPETFLIGQAAGSLPARQGYLRILKGSGYASSAYTIWNALGCH